MWNPFNINWFYDEGAEWIGKTRYYLPIPGFPGNKKPKAITSIILVSVLVIALLGLSIWLGLPDYTYKKLPNFDILYDMMGRTAADVAPIARANPDDLTAVADGTYKMPGGEIYADIAFELELQFKDELLAGFSYAAGATADTKEAAKVISNVSEMFGIESIKTDDGTWVKMSKKLLREYLVQLAEKNQPFVVHSTSNWTPEEHAYQNAVAEYLRKLENDPGWEGRVGAYLVKQACFYNQIDMVYNPDTQWISVQIKFFTDIEGK